MNESSPCNPELRETGVTYRADVGASDLEFPSAPDFDSRPPQLSPSDYAEWCDEMLALFPPKPLRGALQAEARCYVEFVL